MGEMVTVDVMSKKQLSKRVQSSEEKSGLETDLGPAKSANTGQVSPLKLQEYPHFKEWRQWGGKGAREGSSEATATELRGWGETEAKRHHYQRQDGQSCQVEVPHPAMEYTR